MKLNFWKKDEPKPQIQSDPPHVGPFPSVFQMGDAAEEFITSKHWQFFLLFCSQVRDWHLKESSNSEIALQDHACAILMKSLPSRIRMLVYARDKAKQMAENKKKDKMNFAGGNGARGATRLSSV